VDLSAGIVTGFGFPVPIAKSSSNERRIVFSGGPQDAASAAFLAGSLDRVTGDMQARTSDQDLHTQTIHSLKCMPP
jgi:hypothetical protein